MVTTEPGARGETEGDASNAYRLPARLQLLELVAGDGGGKAVEAREGLDDVPPFLFDATEEQRRRLREVIGDWLD